MRINLVTPFAEKDAVKALGARWDPGKKVWYITDVTDLTPFMRWIPDLVAASTSKTAVAANKDSDKNAVTSSTGFITKPSVMMPYCGCQVLPWESCEHSAS